MFPAGQTLEGVQDLAGNVWEWVEDPYTNPMLPGLTGSAPRIVRGGSAWDNAETLRSALRAWSDPENKLELRIGFRCVR
jgi:formylglycine-generating enzyme required for sulfatase activity